MNSNITVENYTELIEYIKVGFKNNFTIVTTDDLEISFVYNYRSNTKIANESSVGAALSYYEYYNYSNSNLELIEAVIYDGWKDEEETWFYSKESATSDGAIDSYEYEKIEFTPFIE